MTTTKIPAVPIASDGLEGWTSCCEAAVTYSGAALCCKACWKEVVQVPLAGAEGDELARIVRAVIDGEITADQGVARQRKLFTT